MAVEGIAAKAPVLLAAAAAATSATVQPVLLLGREPNSQDAAQLQKVGLAAFVPEDVLLDELGAR